MSIFQSPRVVHAMSFAIDCHEGQTRKDKKTHYITHPIGVAVLVDLNGGDENQIIAALLHDTKEDCKEKVANNEIETLFGTDVDDLVDGLTNTSKQTHPDANRAQRKAVDNERLKTVCLRTKLVKLCDIKYNVEDLRGLERGFARKFLMEKQEQVAAVMENVPDDAAAHWNLYTSITLHIGKVLLQYESQ